MRVTKNVKRKISEASIYDITAFLTARSPIPARATSHGSFR